MAQIANVKQIEVNGKPYNIKDEITRNNISHLISNEVEFEKRMDVFEGTYIYTNKAVLSLDKSEYNNLINDDSITYDGFDYSISSDDRIKAITSILDNKIYNVTDENEKNVFSKDIQLITLDQASKAKDTIDFTELGAHLATELSENPYRNFIDKSYLELTLNDFNNNYIYGVVSSAEKRKGKVNIENDETVYAVPIDDGKTVRLATLDENGRIPSSQLNLEATEYLGKINIKRNPLPLTVDSNSPINKGSFYIIDRDPDDVGKDNPTYEFDGETYYVNDWIMWNGSIWEKIEQSTKVSSVNGLQGNVTITSENIYLSKNNPISLASEFTDIRTLISNRNNGIFDKGNVECSYNINVAGNATINGIITAPNLQGTLDVEEPLSKTTYDSISKTGKISLNTVPIEKGGTGTTSLNGIRYLISNGLETSDVTNDNIEVISIKPLSNNDNGGIEKLTLKTISDYVSNNIKTEVGFSKDSSIYKFSGIANKAEFDIYGNSLSESNVSHPHINDDSSADNEVWSAAKVQNEFNKLSDANDDRINEIFNSTKVSGIFNAIITNSISEEKTGTEISNTELVTIDRKKVKVSNIENSIKSDIISKTLSTPTAFDKTKVLNGDSLLIISNGIGETDTFVISLSDLKAYLNS